MVLKTRPSARLHRRYLLIEGSRKAIEAAILEYIGTLGWAKAAPLFVKKHAGAHVLAIRRESLDVVRGAFAVTADTIIVKKVSGTLKGLGVQ